MLITVFHFGNMKFIHNIALYNESLANYALMRNFLLAIFFLLASCGSEIIPDNQYDNYLGVIKTLNSNEINGSYWGIQTGSLDEMALQWASQIGVKWTRLQASWPSVEVVKGKYNWEETDNAFHKMQELGITPVVNLGSGHPAYTELSTYDDTELAEIYGYRAAPPTDNPEAMKGWLNFVEAVVNRYKNTIKYWEIWNEPNHRNYWGAEPNGTDYGRLLKETATLIKQIDPEAIIIGGAMAGIDPDYAREFLDEGTADLIDIISYHHYATLPEERIPFSYELWEVINQYNPGIEIWQGECGYPSHSSTRDYRGTSPWGLKIQAKWLLRQAFTDIYFCKATLSNYFKLMHLGGRGEVRKRTMLRPVDSILGYPERDGARVRTWGVNEKCILSNPSLEPKPAFYAYQNLCAVMDNRYQPLEIDFDVEITNQGMYYGIGKEDDAFPSVPLVARFAAENGNQLLAYWLPWYPQEYTPMPATVNMHLKQCKFRNPVLIDLLSGKVHEINSYSLNNGDVLFMQIPLTDYPYLIAELEEINLVRSE